MFALKKLKTVELNNQNRNTIITFVIEIVNKVTGNGIDKKKNSAMNAFIAIKKIIIKMNAVSD